MFDKITPRSWARVAKEDPKALVVAPTIDNDTARLDEMAKAAAKVVANPPRVLKASESLRNNLERSATQYGDREKQLVKEIADREAELADVRKANAAVVAALIGLEVDVEG